MTGSALEDTVKQLFEVVRHKCTPDEIVVICVEPGCDDRTGHRGINKKTGKTSCWKCNKGGDFVRWARRLGYPLDDQKPMATPINEINLSLNIQPSDPLPPVLEINLPSGFIPCAERPRSAYARLIGEMAEAKNLTLDDLNEAGVGYTRTNPKWEPYAIFPVREYGRTAYYQGRTYVDNPGESTKRFPDRREVRYGAKYWVYNIDEVKALKPAIVIVVESILNVLSLKKHFRAMGVEGVVPVAVFKHYVSSHQAAKLLKHPCIKEMCLLYDHDASTSSWDRAPLLADKIRLSIAEMPLGANGEKSDPNDDVVAAFEAFNNRKQFTVARAVERWAHTELTLPRFGEAVEQGAEPEVQLDPFGLARHLVEHSPVLHDVDDPDEDEEDEEV